LLWIFISICVEILGEFKSKILYLDFDHPVKNRVNTKIQTKIEDFSDKRFLGQKRTLVQNFVPKFGQISNKSSTSLY